MIFDREAEMEGRELVLMREDVQEGPRPGKLTAARLAKVEEVQGRMRSIVNDLNALATEEEHGWVPGTPKVGTARVEPLEKLAAEIAAGVETLEVLYS